MNETWKKFFKSLFLFLWKLLLFAIYISSKFIEGICAGINKSLENYLK